VTPPPVLELRDVAVQAGGRTILDVRSLALAAASTTALLGPNGSGKSTLLRVAAALVRPYRGAVLIEGRPAARADVRSATAAVLQRPLLRRASVRANVESGLRFRGVEPAARRRRAQTWLDRLGLAALADRAAHDLSGGEAQRVSIARALAVAPRVLLLDEPVGALDAPTRGELLADLRDLLAATGTAALLVTHDRHEAAALADRVAILSGGELRQEGPAGRVLDHPADADCARILGFDNVLPGRLLAVAAAEVAVPPDALSVAATSGIRLPARLVRVIPLGPVWRLTLEIEGRTVLAHAREAPPPAVHPGDPIELRVDPSAIRALGEDYHRDDG
jgi:ABC-type sulfate/molybdate transport systems ATPase subunit